MAFIVRSTSLAATATTATLLAALGAAALAAGCSVTPGASPDEDGGAGGIDPNDPNAPQEVGPTDPSGCGGLGGEPCADGKQCKVGKDCVSRSCQGGVCAAPTTTDGVKNGAETDVDCGGPGAPKCGDGKGCGGPGDCQSAACVDGACTPLSATDGVKNGSETDVDCGGPAPGVPRCSTGKTCGGGGDCKDLVCTGGRCAAPTYTDGVKNGDESDVDCGGKASDDGFRACATGKACKAHGDCASDGCAFDGTCAVGRSCTQLRGGRTCGVGDTGQAGAQHESCCEQIAVNEGNAPGGAFRVDKYLVTAGRMRAFLERIDGKPKTYISQNKPAWWDDAWTEWLPVSWDGRDAQGAIVGRVPVSSTLAQVAGGIIHDKPESQGCFLGDTGVGHPTFHVPKNQAQLLYGDTYERWLDKDDLDERPLNCTTWVMMAALCAYDGGQMIGEDEVRFLYDADGDLSNGVSTYPWGSPPAMTCAGGTCTPGAGYDPLTNPHVGGYASVGGDWTLVGPGTSGFANTRCPDCVDDWISWSFNYARPVPDANLPAAERTRRSRDQSYFIPPPGRFPKGASRPFNGDPKQRVQDIAGNMIEMNRTVLAPANMWLTFGNDTPNAPGCAPYSPDKPACDPAGDNVQAVLHRTWWRGGSWEGHAVKDLWSTDFNIVTKYGKAGSRCVYR